jgi:hypothetical protein
MTLDLRSFTIEALFFMDSIVPMDVPPNLETIVLNDTAPSLEDVSFKNFVGE